MGSVPYPHQVDPCISGAGAPSANRRCAVSNAPQQKRDFTPPTVSADLLKRFPLNLNATVWRNFWEVCYGRFQFHPQQVGNLNNWHLNPVWPPSLQAMKLMGWFSHDFPVSLQQRTKQHPHLCDSAGWWTDASSFSSANISNYHTQMLEYLNYL